MFDIIPPREPFVDDKGYITRAWWRFLNNLFMAAGGGTITSSSDVEIIAFQSGADRGPDIELQNATLSLLLNVTTAPLQGRVATLESQDMAMTLMLNIATAPLQGRIATLESVVAQLRSELEATETKRVNLTPIERNLDIVEAVTLGTH